MVFKYGAHMQAYEAIQTIETDIRTLVRLVLGDSWLGVSGLDRAALEVKRQTEQNRRPAAAIEQDLLAYTELTQLQNLILDRAWERFAPALGTKAHIKTYLSKISAYRNPTMHRRSLLPFEEHLVLGISGELRNQIALYRKEREEANMFWPTIEQVTDSFGHAAVGPSGDAGTPGVRLEVGTEVTSSAALMTQNSVSSPGD
jgi:hypothetical protein